MLTLRDFWLVMLVMVLWGLHAPIMKLGVNMSEPLALNFIRFAVTALIFLPFAQKVSRQDLKQLFIVSLFFVSGALMFAHITLDHINSNSFIIIVQSGQIITLLLAWLVFKEKFGAFTAIGIIVSFAGLLVVFGAPDIAENPIGGITCVLGATCWAIGSLAMKKTSHIKPATFLTYTYAMAVPIALCGTFLFEDNQIPRLMDADKPTLLFVILYQALIMGAMTLLWARLMSRNPAHLLTPFLMAQPLIAIIGAYYLLGETLTTSLIAGGLLVIAGLAIINFREIQKKLRR